MEHYDYSQDGYYFVTVCVNKFQRLFGEIVDEKVVLSEEGKIVKKCWLEIPDHFDNVFLDEFVIMPNHVHGIVIIKQNFVTNVGDADLRPLQDRSKMLLSKVIHGYKSSVTRIIRKQLNNCEFQWQRSFYDHVIRNEKGLEKIREYIQSNPLNWEMDDYYKII